jgi:hypothetical protein
LGTPVVIGILLVICTTEFSVCLNIVLRGNGLEEDEELVPREEVFEFICCVCVATAVGVSITLLDVLVTIIIATTNRMDVANANRFIIGVT